MKSIKEQLALPLDTPTVNGRIYSTDVLTKALEDNALKERLENRILPIVKYDADFCIKDGIDIKSIIGVVTGINIRPNYGVYIDGDIFDDNLEIEPSSVTGMPFTLCMEGTVNPDGTIEEVTSIIAVMLTH